MAVPQNESLSTNVGHSVFLSAHVVALPNQHSVEVSHLPVQAPGSQHEPNKANCQEHQGQSGHPCKHKADRPQVKPENTAHRDTINKKIRGAEIINSDDHQTKQGNNKRHC